MTGCRDMNNCSLMLLSNVKHKNMSPTLVYRVSKNVLYPKCKILRIFITIKTIEFGILIYLSDSVVLLAFWRILNQGNRPNKTENTWHYVKRVISCIRIEVGKEGYYKLFSLTHSMLFLFICGCVLCLFWVKINLTSYKWLKLHMWDSVTLVKICTEKE